MSYAAEDEKRLLAHAAESTTQFADSLTRRHCSRRSACKRRVANVKHALLFAATLSFVVACSVMALGLSSLAVGTMRHVAPSCSKHDTAHSPAKIHAPGTGSAVAKSPANPENVGPAVVVDVVDAAALTTPASSFSRLIEAVSPDTLHALLHEYFPDMYKHGVYPSEKSALEVIHRKNAALATSIAQLARRDLNATSPAVVSSTPSSALPVSSAPVTSNAASATTSHAPTSAPSTDATTAPATTAASTHTTKATTAAATSASKKVTHIFTSTINGTPTVVTATSVVGVAATESTSTSTVSGSLQTGAAMPMLSGANAQLAKAVAGVVVGAMFI